MAQLKLKDINKVYDNGFHAVYDFNMDIKQGEFIVFVGPSGCGKSTTLRMIAGLEDITEGELYIKEELVNQKSPRDRGVAMVFQTYALYPNMTVYENMAFGLTLKGLNEDIIEARVKKTAKILGLCDYLERLPRELSGGQRQRVAVGRAIIRKVEVFLMDEPLSNLDAKQRVTMRSELIQIHRRVGATTIYVTHDQTEAMTMADRIVIMKDGYVQQIGKPYDLYFNPANQFVAGFIGEPPMNFIECFNKGDNIVFKDASDVSLNYANSFAEVKNKSQGKDLIFGFRPENAHLIDISKPMPENGYIVDVDVELTEMLGDTVNVYLNIGEHKVIVKSTIYDIPNIGDKRKIFIPYEGVYFFDEAEGFTYPREAK